MISKFHLKTVRPTIDTLPNVAIDSAGDVLFDWYALEIPNGACYLKTINLIYPGTNATAVAGKDIDLLFAKSIKAVAPTSLGSYSDAVTVIKATACKNNIIGRTFIDVSALENDDDLIGYNVLTYGKQGNDLNEPNIIVESDASYASTSGYQTIWVAGIAAEAGHDFGTNVLLDGAIATGDAGAQTLDVSEDADADDVFQVGDELTACASDGSSVQSIGTITSLTADTITIDAKDINGTTVWSSGALANDDEICNRRPLTFHFGFEY